MQDLGFQALKVWTKLATHVACCEIGFREQDLGFLQDRKQSLHPRHGGVCMQHTPSMEPRYIPDVCFGLHFRFFEAQAWVVAKTELRRVRCFQYF